MLRILLYLTLVVALPDRTLPQGSSGLPDRYLRAVYCLAVLNKQFDANLEVTRKARDRSYCLNSYPNVSEEMREAMCEVARSVVKDMEDRQRRLKQYIALHIASGIPIGIEIPLITKNARRDLEAMHRSYRSDKTNQCLSECKGSHNDDCYPRCMGLGQGGANRAYQCVQGDLGLPF